jgi:hypothetical protein
MVRCPLCRRVFGPNVSLEKRVMAERPKRYRTRYGTGEFGKSVVLDKGGEGSEIQRELQVCPICRGVAKLYEFVAYDPRTKKEATREEIEADEAIPRGKKKKLHYTYRHVFNDFFDHESSLKVKAALVLAEKANTVLPVQAGDDEFAK